MISKFWFAAASILIIVILVLLRVNPNEMLNIDEIIPLKVSDSMTARGSLDPNWALADLPEYFKYDQYNFYFYSIVAHFCIQVGDHLGLEPLSALRHLNVFLQAGSILLVADTLRRLGSGGVGIFAAALAMSVFPLMAQDAAMARPESLVYLLAAGLGWLCALRSRIRLIASLIGYVTALGIATKFNFFVFGAPLFFFWLFRNWHAVVGKVWPIIGFGVLGGTAGLVMAMPYAILNFDVFMAGVDHLLKQYSGMHPPHSRPDPGLVSQFAWISGYFLATAGVMILITLVGGTASRESRRMGAFFYAAPFLLMILYFSTKSVFFERNFAQALPAFAVAFGLVIHATHQALKERSPVLKTAFWILSACCILQMTFWTMTINQVSENRGALRKRFEDAHELKNFTTHYLIQDHDLAKITCGKIAILDFNDPQTGNNLGNLRDQGFRTLAVYDSAFNLIPTSTLHTYLDANIVYLEKEC